MAFSRAGRICTTLTKSSGRCSPMRAHPCRASSTAAMSCRGRRAGARGMGFVLCFDKIGCHWRRRLQIDLAKCRWLQFQVHILRPCGCLEAERGDCNSPPPLPQTLHFPLPKPSHTCGVRKTNCSSSCCRAKPNKLSIATLRFTASCTSTSDQLQESNSSSI